MITSSWVLEQTRVGQSGTLKCDNNSHIYVKRLLITFQTSGAIGQMSSTNQEHRNATNNSHIYVKRLLITFQTSGAIGQPSSTNHSIGQDHVTYSQLYRR